MGDAAHEHDRLNRECERRLMGLRHIGHEARTIPAAIVIQCSPIELDIAGFWSKQAEQRFEQRCFAAAIRPKQRQHFPGFHANVEVVADDAITVTDR